MTWIRIDGSELSATSGELSGAAAIYGDAASDIGSCCDCAMPPGLAGSVDATVAQLRSVLAELGADMNTDAGDLAARGSIASSDASSTTATSAAWGPAAGSVSGSVDGYTGLTSDWTSAEDSSGPTAANAEGWASTAGWTDTEPAPVTTPLADGWGMTSDWTNVEPSPVTTSLGDGWGSNAGSWMSGMSIGGTEQGGGIIEITAAIESGAVRAPVGLATLGSLSQLQHDGFEVGLPGYLPRNDFPIASDYFRYNGIEGDGY